MTEIVHFQQYLSIYKIYLYAWNWERSNPTKLRNIKQKIQMCIFHPLSVILHIADCKFQPVQYSKTQQTITTVYVCTPYIQFIYTYNSPICQIAKQFICLVYMLATTVFLNVIDQPDIHILHYFPWQIWNLHIFTLETMFECTYLQDLIFFSCVPVGMELPRCQ